MRLGTFLVFKKENIRRNRRKQMRLKVVYHGNKGKKVIYVFANLNAKFMHSSSLFCITCQHRKFQWDFYLISMFLYEEATSKNAARIGSFCVTKALEKIVHLIFFYIFRRWCFCRCFFTRKLKTIQGDYILSCSRKYLILKLMCFSLFSSYQKCSSKSSKTS